MIELVEHRSSSYAPRTYHNASQGVTLAYAIDHNTAGEKLTQKAAGAKIVMVYADSHRDKLLEAARSLYKALKIDDCHVVNVAGNGIYTFTKHGLTQESVNYDIHFILEIVSKHWEIKKIVSGGQSGADLAGLVAAAKLGIDCTGTWPKGFKMRFEDGIDRNHTYDEIVEIINKYA